MARDASLILADVREPTLALVCEPCGLRGRYRVAWLIERHGDAKLTISWSRSPTARKRARPASTIAVGRYSKGFLRPAQSDVSKARHSRDGGCPN
jgi:hypothetical protein